MRFLLATGESGYPTWRLYGDHDELLAWAGGGFRDRGLAHRAAENFKRIASEAQFDVFIDDQGGYRWIAWLGNDNVAGSGDAYARRPLAESAAALVRSSAATAEGP